MRSPCCLLVFALSAHACLAAPRPEWAFFVPPANAASLLPPSRPGGNQDVLNPPDWYADEHPPMPAIVAHGSRPQEKSGTPLLPCALCHLPNGSGHVESASLAGLSADYIIRQFDDFRSGARQINVGDAGASKFLTTLKGTYSDDQVRAAAGYFATLAPRIWIRVRETRRVPQSVVDPATLMRIRISGTESEPLGERIIELAEDDSKLIERDAHSGYIAYVPMGSIAAGRALVAGAGGRRIACTYCHGRALTGLGYSPPLAGRPPTYLVRQLWNLRSGERRGSLSGPMQTVASALNIDEMLAVAAYVASLPPTAAPSANHDTLR